MINKLVNPLRLIFTLIKIKDMKIIILEDHLEQSEGRLQILNLS